MRLVLKNKSPVEFGRPAPAVFGIVNLTPDSFSDGGKFTDVQSAVSEALAMLDTGAAGVDLGAESTRPGSLEVPAETEIERLLPVLRKIREARPEAILSVDTRKAAVAEAVLDAGADIINDVSAMTFDPRMAEVVAAHDAAVVLMHMRGTPATMRNPEFMLYDNVTDVVGLYLEDAFARAVSAGIRSDAVLLDPGLGFAKNPAQDFELVKNAAVLRQRLRAPLFYGPSRKSFLSQLCPGKKPAERDSATAGILCALAAAKVEIVRVHNVPMSIDVMNAFLRVF